MLSIQKRSSFHTLIIPGSIALIIGFAGMLTFLVSAMPYSSPSGVAVSNTLPKKSDASSSDQQTNSGEVAVVKQGVTSANQSEWNQTAASQEQKSATEPASVNNDKTTESETQSNTDTNSEMSAVNVPIVTPVLNVVTKLL